MIVICELVSDLKWHWQFDAVFVFLPNDYKICQIDQ